MNKRRRIFIAINLPADVKKYLAKYRERFSDLPAKWMDSENLHMTLSFLGDVTDEELGEICIVIKNIAVQHPVLHIVLDKISYGPDKKILPKLIWASGEKSQPLNALKNNLENILLEKVPNFKSEHKGFAPHVTLARVKAMEWRAMEPEERPEVTENIDLVFTAESIEVMESELKRGGPRYLVIESCELKG